MTKKKIIIFITVFILVGATMLGIYWYLNRNKAGNTDEQANILQKFNPFGTGGTIDTNTPQTGVGTTEPGSVISLGSRFHQITKFAVAGASFFVDERTSKKKPQETATAGQIALPEVSTEQVPSLRYVEKATGHVYQIYLDTKVEGKVSNATVPSVHEVIFDSTASSMIYRYFSVNEGSISSFLATLGQQDSSFLSPNILEIGLSPDKKSFFSIIKSANGVIGTTRSFDATKATQVFTSAFTEWLPQWVKEKNIYLTTKPSYTTEGSMFSLDTTSGTLTKILGGILGLTTLASPDGSLVLFGASLDSGPHLNIFNIKDHTSIDLKTYGLPEKCVWSKDGINIYCAVPNTILGTQFPDVWYQGLVSFDDYFVKINTQSNEVYTLANSAKETPVDGTSLFLDNDELNLYFINKKDSTLWSLDI